jgi:HK97 family phage prohead protease
VTERGDDDIGTSTALRGLAIATDTMSVDLGGFVETIRHSALDRFTNERPDLRSLWSHDHALPLGRMSAGTMRARVTAQGLLVEVDAPRGAAHYVDLIARRDVSQQSFGFIVPEDGDEWMVRGDSVVREVLDMHVLETSFVAWPAYRATSVEVIRGDRRSEWWREERTALALKLAR